MDKNRKTAYATLLEIEKTGAYSNIELNHQIAENKPDAPGFVRELVYGVLENKILIDYYLDKLIPSGIAKVKKQDLVLLRMGIYQIARMDSVPEYAAVNETVEMGKILCKGRDKFINGVLRGFIKKKDTIKLPDPKDEPIKYLCVKYSVLEWIAILWIDRFGFDEAEQLLMASNETSKLSVRVNRLKTREDDLKQELEGRGFEVKDGANSSRILFVKGDNILDTLEYKSGLFSVQDEGSVLIVEALDPKPKETIIDMCAAPGGKTMAIAEMMENKGKIYAFDIYDHKLDLINREAERVGTKIISTENIDGEKFQSALVECADRVLIDAPCSGLGVIRKKPEIKYKQVLGNAAELAEKQLKILSNGSKYVKYGGFLVYSTCTINAIENEEVIKSFMEYNTEFELMEQKQLLPHVDGTDGMFYCKMKRIKG